MHHPAQRLIIGETPHEELRPFITLLAWLSMLGMCWFTGIILIKRNNLPAYNLFLTYVCRSCPVIYYSNIIHPSIASCTLVRHYTRKGSSLGPIDYFNNEVLCCEELRKQWPDILPFSKDSESRVALIG